MARAVQSMTGSGAATGTCELGVVSVEIRAVNGRGVSLRCRFPPECVGLESSIEKWIRARFVRGSFVVAVDVEANQSDPTPIDAAMFAAGAKRLRELASAHGFAEPILGDVLMLPGVVASVRTDRVRTSWEPSAELTAIFERAVAALDGRRVAEGRATIESMNASLDQLAVDLDCVQQRAPELAATRRDLLIARVNEFLDQHGTQLTPTDVIREVALFADRVDISEEMQRLGAHVERMRADLAGAGPIGRDLEFLLQEMLREVNTLGSKSPDVEISHRVVAMKSAIDKLKEQAANLE